MTDFYWDSDPDIRSKHLYIPGLSGYGKTSLMANLALEDIVSLHDPVIVIDPKGSKQGLVERIVRNFPQELVDQAFYLSLRHPVPIDMMGWETQEDRNRIKGDIITILKRFSYGSWGPTMQSILNNLVPTLLEAEDATFLDIAGFLENKKRQHEILERVSPARRDYWKENPPSKADLSPITSRMSNFKEPPLNTIVGAKRGEGLSISEIIEERKILLVDTSPLSEDGLMLGALIMSRIQQAIFKRSPDEEHPCCHVYADEFHNFTTSAFNVMLSQARSYNLSLCMANQHPKQITEIWDDIIGCVSSYVIFQLAGEHAAMLKSKIREIDYDPPHKKIDKSFIKARIKHLEARENYLAYSGRELTPEQSAQCDAESEKHRVERWELEELLKTASPPKSYFEQIPHLQKGKALYIAHDKTTALVSTPLPPQCDGPGLRAEIITHTKEYYAQKVKKRTVDKYSSQTPPKMVSLKEDGNPGPATDEIEPQTRAVKQIPAHRDRPRHPRGAR